MDSDAGLGEVRQCNESRKQCSRRVSGALSKSLLKLNMKENAHNHLSSPSAFLIILFFTSREFITSVISSYNKMLLSLEEVIAC